MVSGAYRFGYCSECGGKIRSDMEGHWCECSPPALTKAQSDIGAFHKWLFQLQKLQSEALALGLPIASRVLNQAQNTAGWELAGESDRAISKLREEFGR